MLTRFPGSAEREGDTEDVPPHNPSSKGPAERCTCEVRLGGGIDPERMLSPRSVQLAEHLSESPVSAVQGFLRIVTDGEGPAQTSVAPASNRAWSWFFTDPSLPTIAASTAVEYPPASSTRR